MKESKVNYENIKTICDKLVAEGQKPTVAVIRQQLGFGSYTTITEHLRQWNKTLLVVELTEDEIAREIKLPIKNLFQKKVDHYYKEYQFKIIVLNNQLEEAYAEKIQADILCEAQADEIEKLSAGNLALRAEVDALKASLAILDGK